MSPRTYNVLFLCTGNSARSIMAESILNTLGQGRFRAYSAGSHPAGSVNPVALDVLRGVNCATSGLRSKSWDEFASAAAPRMDFVFTVCDHAAGETCPLWPGNPITAHWGVQDPVAFAGTDAQRREVFRNVAIALRRRIELFISLPFERLDALALGNKVREIGKQ